MSTPKYTDEQAHDWARQVVLSDVADPDFIGVAEQHEEAWEELDLTKDEFDVLHLRVHDLACAAHVIVTWDPARYRALERLAAAYGTAFASFLDEERAADEQEEDADALRVDEPGAYEDPAVRDAIRRTVQGGGA